jgi:hypothetical protein
MMDDMKMDLMVSRVEGIFNLVWFDSSTVCLSRGDFQM